MKTILIVEDDPMIADVLSDIIVALGHSVIVAGTGSEAVNIVDENNKPDLVIMDLELPDAPGLVVAQQLVDDFPRLKVLYSTGYSEQESKIDFSNPSCVGIVHKPYEISDIQSAIEKTFL